MATFNITASADAKTEAITVSELNTGTFSFQCEVSALDAGDGVLSIEYSNDRQNWQQVPTLVETLAIGASSTHFNINAVNHKYYRVSWGSGTNTAGTITITTSR